MGLSHIEIKWTRPEPPWICRAEWYTPTNTWKTYRGIKTKCKKPRYQIFDPCHELSPKITKKYKIRMVPVNEKKYIIGEIGPAHPCVKMAELYAILAGADPGTSNTNYMFQENNEYISAPGEYISLQRKKTTFSFFASPSSTVPWEDIIGCDLRLRENTHTDGDPRTTWNARIMGWGFSHTYVLGAHAVPGYVFFGSRIMNTNFHCTRGETHILEIATEDYISPRNTGFCQLKQAPYKIRMGVTGLDDTYIFTGERNTWVGDFDPPLEGDQFICIRTDEGKFMPICPVRRE